jgi:hypothetical protein
MGENRKHQEQKSSYPDKKTRRELRGLDWQ